MATLNMVSDIIDRTIEFIDQVYIPDLLAIAGFYKDWAKWGGGLSGQNVMSYGEFPDIAERLLATSSMLLPSGVILGGDLKKVLRRRPEGARPGAGMGDALLVQVRATRPRACIRSTASPIRTSCSGQDTKGTRTNIENLDETRQVLVGQVAALEGQRGRGRPAGALHRRLRPRQQGDHRSRSTAC